MKKPATPQARPNNSVRRSPNFGTIRPTSPACTITLNTPTIASTHATCLSFHLYWYSANSTKMLGYT